MSSDVMSPELRTAIYGLVAVTAPLLAAFGLITEEKVPLMIAWCEAFVGVLVAFWHRPTRKP